LKIEYQQQEYMNPAVGSKPTATQDIRHDLGMSERTIWAWKSGQHPVSDETQEDNATSASSQHPLIGESGNEGGSGANLGGMRFP